MWAFAGMICSTDIRKMFRMLGLIPAVLFDEELMLLMDNFREGGEAVNLEEELALEWDDFVSLCKSVPPLAVRIHRPCCITNSINIGFTFSSICHTARTEKPCTG